MNLNHNIAPNAGQQRCVSPDATAAVNRLTRGEVEAALNWGGYATWDHELTSELRALLAECIEDGELSMECVVLS